MDKPFTIAYEEFKQKLANIINESGLAAAMIEPILQIYLNEISNIAKNQYLIDKNKYEELLKKEASESEGDYSE